MAHEWFHAFDNLISEAMTGENINVFLTNPARNFNREQKKLYKEIKELEGREGDFAKYRLERLKKEAEKQGMNFGGETDYAKVKEAFSDLARAMSEGDVPVTAEMGYSAKDYLTMKYNFTEERKKSVGLIRRIVEAGNVNEALKLVRGSRWERSWTKVILAYYGDNPNGGTVTAETGERRSRYLVESMRLESGAKPYWSTPHEMAARAFSAYVDDKLREKGRFNDYLAYATKNEFYLTENPYPEGEERKKINGAFEKLFSVIRETNAIRKALRIDGAVFKGVV